MITIHWNSPPHVGAAYVTETEQAVNAWINSHWSQWHDGQSISNGMNVGHPVILIGFNVRFNHAEGQAPSATVTRCQQVAEP